MMSVSPVSAGAAASGYYKTEGYYAAGSEDGDAAAHWFGKAAEELGLAGRVDDNLFAELLDGQVFKAGKEGPEPDRLMGLDLTFSAPKSVSIAALVFEDDRLIAAHDTAAGMDHAYALTTHDFRGATVDRSLSPWALMNALPIRKTSMSSYLAHAMM